MEIPATPKAAHTHVLGIIESKYLDRISTQYLMSALSAGFHTSKWTGANPTFFNSVIFRGYEHGIFFRVTERLNKVRWVFIGYRRVPDVLVAYFFDMDGKHLPGYDHDELFISDLHSYVDDVLNGRVIPEDVP